MTPLMQAAQSGHHSLVSTLIQAGSSLSASSACGYTALHLGCIHGRSGVVETLVLAGANVNRRVTMHVSIPCYCMLLCSGENAININNCF